MGVCEQWEVLATPIGGVTDSGRLRVLDRGTWSADLPVAILVDDCPLYDLEPAPPREPLYAASRPAAAGRESRPTTLLALLAIAEHRLAPAGVRAVRPDRAVAHGAPARGGRRRRAGAAVRGHGQRRSRSRSTATAGASRATLGAGAAEAVYECAANLACVGAEPLGLTNCLNFGNPEKPHVAWQLTEAVEGLAEACEALGVPVVGGNVSLYNEAPTGPIFPTPVVGMVGKLPRRDAGRPARFARDGRRDRAGRAVRAVPGRVGAGEAPGPAPAGALPADRRESIRVVHERGPRRASAPAPSRAPTTSPRAASWWPSPSAASPAASAPTVGCPMARPVRGGAGTGLHRLGSAEALAALS